MFNILDVPCNSGALWSWLSEFGPVQKVTINEISSCRRSCLVLPGGNNPLVFIGCEHAIHEALENQNKLFGCCGGFQFFSSLLTESESECKGLGIVDAETVKNQDGHEIGMKTLHWFDGSDVAVYFNHSFSMNVSPAYTNKNALLAGQTCVAFKNRQVLGLQFHPELSLGGFNEAFRAWLNET